MTSALSPRDIQTRIRSGASLEDVAQESGMPVEKVEPFAAPVLAEREHVAGSALQCPVRRRGETGSVRAMRAVVQERLATLGLDVDEDVVWDAWRNEDRRWSVVGRYTDNGTEHTATFTFDQRARFSVAADDDARWLIGEYTPPAPGVMDSPDAEPTIDLNDELALVRAVQGSAPIVATPSDEPKPMPSPVVQPREVVRETVVERVVEVEEVVAPEPASPQADDRDETEVEDYSPAELEQVDGIYDIVPSTASEMDVLYEMLSSFNEDSVNIYAGLTNPITPDAPASSAPEAEDDGPVEPLRSAEEYAAPAPVEVDPQDDPQVAQLDWVSSDVQLPATDDSQPATTPSRAAADGPEDTEEGRDEAPRIATPSAAPEVAEEEHPALEALQTLADDVDEAPAETPSIPDEEPAAPEVVAPARATVEAEPAAPSGVTEAPAQEEPVQVEPEAVVAPGHPTQAQPDAARRLEAQVTPEVPVAPEPEATAVEAKPDPEKESEKPATSPEPVAEAAPEPPKPAAKPKPKSRKKRASVPSWDEIMFGGPTPNKG